jgi:hypothetical protein
VDFVSSLPQLRRLFGVRIGLDGANQVFVRYVDGNNSVTAVSWAFWALNAIHDHLRLPRSISRKEFIDQLIKRKVLRVVQLTSPYEQVSRFVASSATPYNIAVSLRQGSYLCHQSILALHGIVGTKTSRVFVNKEQSPKPQSEVTSQESIDRAFENGTKKLEQYLYERGRGFRPAFWKVHWTTRC